MSHLDTEAASPRPQRKRTRNPKRKRHFEMPDSEDHDEPIIGPGNEDHPGRE